MSRDTLRKRILVHSVQDLLPGEKVRDVAMIWTRHRWFVPYVCGAALVLLVVAIAVGIEAWVNRIMLAGCGMAVGGLATTNWWVLAETGSGLALLRSSRIRQFARSLERRLPDSTTIEMVSSTVITSEWRVDESVYSTTKRWEAFLRRLSSQN